MLVLAWKWETNTTTTFLLVWFKMRRTYLLIWTLGSRCQGWGFALIDFSLWGLKEKVGPGHFDQIERILHFWTKQSGGGCYNLCLLLFLFLFLPVKGVLLLSGRNIHLLIFCLETCWQKKCNQITRFFKHSLQKLEKETGTYFMRFGRTHQTYEHDDDESRQGT